MACLGIDIGGTKVALRLEHAGSVNEPAKEFSFDWSRFARAEQDLRMLEERVRLFLAGRSVQSVGVAMPASLDTYGVVRTWPGRPTWTGVDVLGVLRALFPSAKLRCRDDGDLAAIAEARHAGCANLAYLGLGTGVGGGLVLNDNVYPEQDTVSCEIGHIVVERGGPRCDCGRRGCLQAVASGPATLRRAARLRGAEVTAADLGSGLAEGDSWAVDAIEHTGAALAAAIVSLEELFHPELFLIGGGFGAGVAEVVPSAVEQVRLSGRTGQTTPAIGTASLGHRSSLHGAVLLARRSLRDDLQQGASGQSVTNDA